MTGTVTELPNEGGPAPGTDSGTAREPSRDGGHDFDFLLGTWRRHDRRLHRTASGSSEWQEFEGTSVVRPLWDGQGNFEDYRAAGPDGPIRAVSLHLYNPRTRQWSLSWANSSDGALGPAVVGQFRNGRGEFFSFEQYQGRMVYLRLTWTRVSPTEAGFEQALSTDGGRTWEANWIMRFTRVTAADPAPADEPAAGIVDGQGRDGMRGFDFLQGEWRVHNRRLRRPLTGSTEWYEFEGRSVERSFWNGQGNLEEYEGDSPDGRIRGLALRLYDPHAKQWSIHWANSAAGTLDRAMVGEFQHGRGEFYNRDQLEGREVLVRFLWSSSGPGAARWEQAFSDDGGRTWETNWVMDFARGTGERSAAARPGVACCPVVELRQYALHPGMRDSLIALFDRELIEPQEAAGMQVIGQFRDIDRPDVFTWLRGFPDMPSRARSLGAFYGGPVWAAHRDAANGTMISSDNVRLLRPARAGRGFVLAGGRPGPGAAATPPGLVVATIYTLVPEAADDFASFFDRAIEPRLAANGTKPFAVFETEPSANTFPRLPVREGEHAVVWFAHYADLAAYERFAAGLARDREWVGEVRPALEHRLSAPSEIWRLTPTARSRTLR